MIDSLSIRSDTVTELFQHVRAMIAEKISCNSSGLVPARKSKPRIRWYKSIGCFFAAFALLAILTVPASLYAENAPFDSVKTLPRPGNKSPDMTKKLRVFILMGQPNMVGMADLGPQSTQGTLEYLTKTKNKYPWLLDDAGNCTVRKDVYYYDARLKKGSPLSPRSNNGRTFGPEVGFGYVVGHALGAPVLIIKSCIGGRSLGWDLLPLGSKRYVVNGRTYAGYKDTPQSWIEGQPKKVVNWYAGEQYDRDVANAKYVLNHLAKCDPQYKGQGYEIAGFVFWQGWNDQNKVYASRYEHNLVHFIKSVRKDCNAPDAKFVLATVGFRGWNLKGPGLSIANGQLAVSDPKKYPEFVGNVKTVEARNFWHDIAVSPNKRQIYHYYHNAQTYYEVGNALGQAMMDLLNGKGGGTR